MKTSVAIVVLASVAAMPLGGCANVVYVTDSDGRPVDRAHVVLVYPKFLGRASLTDSAGRTEVQVLPHVQPTSLWVGKSGYADAKIPFPSSWPAHVKLSPESMDNAAPAE